MTSIDERADAPKPYGDVPYADPVHGKYPIDTAEHARAAWDYINMPKNQEGYSAGELRAVMDRIKAACEKFGIKLDDAGDGSDDAPDERARGPIEERAANLGGVDFADRIISVVAVPYESPTQVEYRGEMWREVFSRSAFNGLRPDAPNARTIPVSAVLRVPAFDHKDGQLVGRVINAVPNRPDGLGLELKISKTTAGDETLELAHDKALFPSVGFAARGGDHRLDRHNMTRRVNRAFLHHVAFVHTPAYANAKVLSVRADHEDKAVVTPALDEFYSDPIFQWAEDRLRPKQ